AWRGVHDRGKAFTMAAEGSRRLEIDRRVDPLTLGLFVLRSEVDAEREGLHVEVEAADRAAGEQFERAGHRPCARAVGRSGLEVRAGRAIGGDRSRRGRESCGERAGGAGVRSDAGGQAAEARATGLRL